MRKFIYFILFLLLIQFFKNLICYAHPSKIDFGKAYTFYKENYLLREGRVIDPLKKDITTSESQAYVLFISLITNDKPTFDLVYNWTSKKLRRKDGLFSWLWGKAKNGEYEVLDYNSAADADVHIARCLISAYEKWHQKSYLHDALKTINSIWNRETKIVDGHRVLMPGAEQTKSFIIEVNPSYFAPYSFRIFKKYDKRHNWNKLIDSSYFYLNASMAKTKTGLPPNWFLIENGKIVLENSQRSDFSYDAIRVFWRIYSDYKNTGDKRDLEILSKSKFFIKKWKEDKNLYVNYQANGQLRDTDKPLGSIAILIPAIDLYDKKVANEIFDTEIVPNLSVYGLWKNKNDYYGISLLWFGKYMYVNKHFLK